MTGSATFSTVAKIQRPAKRGICRGWWPVPDPMPYSGWVYPGDSFVHARKNLATATVCAVFGFGFISAHFAYAQKPAGALGVFTGQSDVGTVTPPGTAGFDAKTGAYTLSSAGGDLWAAEDDFHFVWKKASGDLAITADIQVAKNDPAAHPLRKGFLMIRESLDTDAKYVDAAVHGNGETAIQYRRSKGDTTQDIAFNIGAPQRVRLEKRGDTFTLFISMHGETLHQAGASMKVPFSGEFYVGLGVCAHDAHKAQSATFGKVEIAALQPAATTAK